LERILDVSELEAPEPLIRAVAALESLPRGDYLRFRHRMKPCHLYPLLEKHGLACDTRQGAQVECELFIWHADDAMAEAEARLVADTLQPWRD
jgi:hypothetical protein